MPVGDIPGWHQIFTDDFTTNVSLGSFPGAVSSKWDAYNECWQDTSKNGRYYPSRVVSIKDGVMNLHIHTEILTGSQNCQTDPALQAIPTPVHMVSAPLPKLPGGVGSQGGLLYGRYAIRFKADPIPNYKTAWLLWPDSEVWPRDGEIDFPEGNLDSSICAYMHRQNGVSGSDQDAYCTTTTFTSWHTAIIEWSPNKANFIIDGISIGTSTIRVPNTPMHWVIQTETATNGITPSNAAAGDVQIDWVAVYVPS